MRAPEEIAAGLGRVVRGRREAAGLTRGEFAERSGLSPRFVAQIELGQANPSLASLAQLANATGMRLEELLAEAGALPSEKRPIALLGLRGAGKSAVGKRLARSLELPFVELDSEVEAEAGLSIAEIFELHGQENYRRREREALARLLQQRRRLVMATGGGVVTEPDTYQDLRRNCRTVWLRASPEEHWRRVVAQGDLRPMEGNRRAFDDLCAILEEREPLYEQAEHTIDTSGRNIAQITSELARLFAVS